MGSWAKTQGKWFDDRDTLHKEKELFGSMFHCVYLSSAHRRSTPKAKVLLQDLCYQYRGHNNGKLVLCPREKDLIDGFTVLGRSGLSETSVYRAAAELEVLGLIVCTRRGNFARRVSYYAVTWAPLDKTNVDYSCNLGFITPPHWWKKGPPDWYLTRLKDASKTHRRMVETICGSQRDNQEGLTVVPETTANVQ
ncbi:MAG: hypothetical protein QGH37_33450 [Candidatus Poribacteria bacterium]|jgi:hypothetical protein|nr:hypothetical protein [Candidatus Poribacteria bacterium]